MQSSSLASKVWQSRVFVVLAVTALVLIGTGGISEPTLTPGDTIMSSITLSADIDATGYTGTVFTIGADGVTIDGGGHTIVAPNAACVFRAAARSNLTITNLTISTPTKAVDLATCNNVAITNISGQGVARGVYSSLGDGLTITGCDFSCVNTETGVNGLEIVSTNNVVIQGNNCSGRSGDYGRGIFIRSNGVVYPTHCLVGGSTALQGNICQNCYRGIETSSCHDVTIQHNITTDSLSGVLAPQASGLTIADNKLDYTRANGGMYGLWLTSARDVTIQRNDLSGRKGNGALSVYIDGSNNSNYLIGGDTAAEGNKCGNATQALRIGSVNGLTISHNDLAGGNSYDILAMAYFASCSNVIIDSNTIGYLPYNNSSLFFTGCTNVTARNMTMTGPSSNIYAIRTNGLTLDNLLVAGDVNGISAPDGSDTDVSIAHCTVTGCVQGIQVPAGSAVTNSIIWGNSVDVYQPAAGMTITYSDIGQKPSGQVWPGQGNISADPLFVDAATGDYSLKSNRGHWNAAGAQWVLDTLFSPCIDAGDPTSSFANEPAPNGGRVNMGADGNTAYASKGDLPPTAPTTIAITPTNPTVASDLTAAASGSTDPELDPVSYTYEWSKSADGGSTWSAWGNAGATLPHALFVRGNRWKARARANDTMKSSDWVMSSAVTIQNSVPTLPTTVAITPAMPLTNDSLVASASGSTDGDADTLSYQYQWCKSTDGGSTWTAWSDGTATMAAAGTTKGEQWKVRGRASDGMALAGLSKLRGVTSKALSAWTESAVVTIADTAPTVAGTPTLAPASANTGDPLVATWTAATDADADSLTYAYSWSKNGTPVPGLVGTTADLTTTLDPAQTTKGDQWTVSVIAQSGEPVLKSAAVASLVRTIGNTYPEPPQQVAITPAAPSSGDTLTALASGATDADSDQVTYNYQWRSSDDGGIVWTDWGNSVATIAPALTSKGQKWQARACSSDGTATSAWVLSDPVTIQNSVPTLPTTVAITPAVPLTNDNLIASASGSTDGDADTLTYQYQWCKSTDGGSTWTPWSDGTATMAAAGTTKGERWKVRARASDGMALAALSKLRGVTSKALSAWTESAVVTIADTAPTVAGTPTLAPASANTGDPLVATWAAATDADGDSLTYAYSWSKNGTPVPGLVGTTADLTTTLDPAQTTRGDQWTVSVIAQSGEPVLKSAAVASLVRAIGNTCPEPPQQVAITPAAPFSGDTLTALASGATDADSDQLSYNYQWRSSDDGGILWTDWGNSDAAITPALTSKGQKWQARACSNDGTATSAWVPSDPVTIQNSVPTAPLALSIRATGGTPDTYDFVATAAGSADGDQDAITYEYQWSSSPDGGTTWGVWGFDNATLAHADLAAASHWRVRARATDGTAFSAWTTSSAVSSAADTLYVDAAVASSGDGASWASAVKTITEAINLAVPGGTIVVAQGTYHENLNFGGKTITITSTDPSSPSVSAATIIDGGSRGPVVSFVSGESAATLLTGFTITHGSAEYGGGIVCQAGAAPTISRNRIQSNVATKDGGGISARYASPVVTDNTISDNEAMGSGGGLRFAGGGTAMVARNIVRNNKAPNGAGVICDGASPQLSENTIRNNAGIQGGGICCRAGAEPTISANSLSENQADYGGAIYCEAATPSVTGNTVSANSADGGGGLYLYNCSPAVSENTIVDNTADDGAGLFGQGCGSTVRDSIFAGNTATRYGGGIYLLNCTAAQLENDTLDGNRAVTKGGGVCLEGSPARLHNSIISNSPAGGGVYLVNGPLPTITFCNVYNNLPADYMGMTAPASRAIASAAGNLRIDPGYADRAMRDYHLKSQSGRWNPATGAWVIDTSHSACIDKGDPASSYGLEPQPNGGRRNIGAYGNTPEASKGMGLMVAHTPATNVTSCSRTGAVLVTFRWPVAQASAEEHLRLSTAQGPVAGTCDWLSPFVRVRFTPTRPLEKNTLYTLGLASGIRRRDGSLVKWDESFCFTTGSEPVVTSCAPKGAAVNVRSKIIVGFDTPMHRLSVQNTFKITPSVTGTLTWSGQQMTFSHAAAFAPGTTYRVCVGAKARSSAGNELGRTFTWNFTTAGAAAPSTMNVVAVPTAVGAQIGVTLAAAADVSVSVRNLAGYEVAALQPGTLEAGSQLLVWNRQSTRGSKVPAGTYLVHVRARLPQGGTMSGLVPLRLK